MPPATSRHLPWRPAMTTAEAREAEWQKLRQYFGTMLMTGERIAPFEDAVRAEERAKIVKALTEENRSARQANAPTNEYWRGDLDGWDRAADFVAALGEGDK